MLQAGEVIDADVVRDWRVVFSIGADVNQRGSAAPVFVRRVGKENLGKDFFRSRAVEQTAVVSVTGSFSG